MAYLVSVFEHSLHWSLPIFLSLGNRDGSQVLRLAAVNVIGSLIIALYLEWRVDLLDVRRVSFDWPNLVHPST